MIGFPQGPSEADLQALRTFPYPEVSCHVWHPGDATPCPSETGAQRDRVISHFVDDSCMSQDMDQFVAGLTNATIGQSSRA